MKDILKDINEELNIRAHAPHELDSIAWEKIFYGDAYGRTYRGVEACFVGTNNWVIAGQTAFNKYMHEPDTVKFRFKKL